MKYIPFHIFSVVNDQVSLVISRQILTEICVQLTKLPDEISSSISHYTLDKVQPRVISFEEQVATIRQHLSSIYERQEQFREAANVLGLIPLETGQRQGILLFILNGPLITFFCNFQTILCRL